MSVVEVSALSKCCDLLIPSRYGPYGCACGGFVEQRRYYWTNWNSQDRWRFLRCNGTRGLFLPLLSDLTNPHTAPTRRSSPLLARQLHPLTPHKLVFQTQLCPSHRRPPPQQGKAVKGRESPDRSPVAIVCNMLKCCTCKSERDRYNANHFSVCSHRHPFDDRLQAPVFSLSSCIFLCDSSRKHDRAS
jgi:hypothetical protein